jgi:phosphoglycolate phosphatase-like HAD superfamily hydrolase
VRALAERWPLGLASSSNRPLIDLVLGLTGLAPCFRVTVSSEEVGRGKPAPDVYLEPRGGWSWNPRAPRRSRIQPTEFAPPRRRA